MFFFDGAMGTMLQQSGLQEGDCPELCNIDHPEWVERVHKAYLQAGAQFVTTNTFGGTPLKLAEYGLEDRCDEINGAAVRLAKRCIQELGVDARVAGDMGPTGQFMRPLGTLTFDEVHDTYYAQAKALLAAGADAIIIETIIDIQEMRAALLGALDARRDLGRNDANSDTYAPVICQLAYAEDGRTVTGTDPENAAILLEAMGADVIGTNCSLGPAQLLPLVERMATVTNVPLIVQPNAGLPTLVNGNTVFPLSPEEMAEFVPALMDAGATYLGGCCGTSPAHIEAIRKKAESYTPKEREKVRPFSALTSRTHRVRIGQNEKPVIIGERINPTGRKVLAKEIAEGSFSMVKRDALQQVEAGAHILDVNMGVPKIDQAQAMEEAVTILASLVEVPLSIDSIDAKVLEAGLKAYPGRALINSVNAEEEQIQAVMPLAKRYGACLLCLPLGRGDLPKTAEERIDLAKYIVSRAYEYGLRKQDLLLDPLVLTLASGQDAGRETLRTLSLYKQIFGFPTVMGLSNVSFGLPARPYLNGQFLTMAVSQGLTCPIANPLNYEVKKAFDTACTLLGFDEGAAEFIAKYANDEGATGSSPGKVRQSSALTYDPENPLYSIQQAVERGEKEEVGDMVAKALEAGVDPLSITRESLGKAMEEVGEKFGAGKLFLPQVMMCAETMQVAFQKIKELLPAANTLSCGKVLLATVKGDIHDLGKNIVAALLENNGYEVIDIGKDVDPEEIVEAVRREKPHILGLASLMTTTMPHIDETIKAVREAGLDVKIMVGGAVLTPDYAAAAGADKYVRDGISAVKVAHELRQGEA